MTKGEKIVKNMIAMRKGKIAIYFCNQIQVAVRAKYERRFVSQRCSPVAKRACIKELR